ncbi:hypothetical protein C0993_003774 [Termitomyces sp. T159_Od127]|nr:hypothetical protein C0993_003774 [Termitomyces sp. T159_Od127]
MAAVTFQDEQPNILRSTKIFGYREGRRGWRHMSARKYEEQVDHPSSIQLVTWNLDHRAPNPKGRIFMALRHLETYVFKCNDGQSPVACCIMLQEVHPDALQCLLDDPWIRRHFVVTPVTTDKWRHGYGNVTLVARTVVVVFAGTLNFGYSSAGRGAIVVDLKVSSPRANEPQDMVLRMINTHLEPGALGIRMRRVQLGVLSSLLREKEHVRGGVIAGGMNAVSPEDFNLPTSHRLMDAWIFPNKNPSGITWGLQDSGDLPPARLDKVLYVERRKAYTIDSPKRIGMGLLTFDESGTRNGWVSDHFGLLTRLLVRAR